MFRRVGAISFVVGLLLAGCSASNNEIVGEPIVVGQAIENKRLDPAGAYSSSDFEVMYQIYPFLLSSNPQDPELKPDIATSAEFISPRQYEVKIKPNLKFANGNDLTASDVAFSLNRQLNIMDEFGPGILLGNLENAEIVDDLTVIFNLKINYDQTFPYVLSSVPGLIVDEEVFPFDEILDNDKIIESQPFAGPYKIETFKINELIYYVPNPEYKGLWGPVKNNGVIVKYYSNTNNLVFDAQRGELDVVVAYRSVGSSEINQISDKASMNIQTGAGGEPGFLAFNLKAMPYGSETPEADASKALAVRQAIAHLVDRNEISNQAYLNSYQPAFSFVPSEIPGSYPHFKEIYGDSSGAPSNNAAEQVLRQANVATPVSFELLYSSDRYGQNTEAMVALLKNQLESSELFKVDLVSAEWSSIRELRRNDGYQVIQLFWGPDYGDADNYLTPVFISDGWLKNHYSNAALDEILLSQAQANDWKEREDLLRQAQKILAEDISVIPLIEGGRIALTKPEIKGVAETLDSSFKLRYSFFSRG